ncbi:MAG: hypothetical protein ACTHOD_02350 [Motilibacteraceae bacterium]
MHRRHLLAPAAALALLAVTAAPALAAGGLTMHRSIDLLDPNTPRTEFTCGELTLTPVAGRLDGVFHESVDGQGRYHYTGTNVAHDVVLTDLAHPGTGGSYRLVGTSSFGGTSTDDSGEDNLRFRSEVSFVVLRPDGGRLGMVRLLERMDADGAVRVAAGGCIGSGGIE